MATIKKNTKTASKKTAPKAAKAKASKKAPAKAKAAPKAKATKAAKPAKATKAAAKATKAAIAAANKDAKAAAKADAKAAKAKAPKAPKLSKAEIFAAFDPAAKTDANPSGKTVTLKSGAVVPAFKYCSKCDADHPADAFYANAGRPSGLGDWCKACFKACNDARKAAKAS